MYRLRNSTLEVLLVHPGGPFGRKGLGSVVIPKGEFEEHEDRLSAAKREFRRKQDVSRKGILLLSLHANAVERLYMRGQ